MTPQLIRNERRILGGAVRQIRKLQKRTQSEVATAAGINFTTYSHLENGRQPSLDVMCRVASALGADLDDVTYFVNVYVVHEDAA